MRRVCKTTSGRRVNQTHNNFHFVAQMSAFYSNMGEGYKWVDGSARGGVPPGAVLGGKDGDGSQIYVGKAFFKGDWIPAKIIPSRRQAYVSHDGKEHEVSAFQVLCQNQFVWVKCRGGIVPANAVKGGVTSHGETLYVGRVNHKGALTVGKVHPSHGSCYIPFGGSELGFRDYEVLVFQ